MGNSPAWGPPGTTELWPWGQCGRLCPAGAGPGFPPPAPRAALVSTTALGSISAEGRRAGRCFHALFPCTPNKPAVRPDLGISYGVKHLPRWLPSSPMPATPTERKWGAHAVSWTLGLREGFVCLRSDPCPVPCGARGLASGVRSYTLHLQRFQWGLPSWAAHWTWRGGWGPCAQERGSLWGSDGLVLHETHELSCQTLGRGRAGQGRRLLPGGCRTPAGAPALTCREETAGGPPHQPRHHCFLMGVNTWLLSAPNAL